MKQPEQISTAIAQFQQMNSLSQTRSTSLAKPEQEKLLAIKQKFGTQDQFLQKVNPQTQSAFAMKQEFAVMGDYPTLTDICLTYGKTFSEQWLYPQIVDVALFTGVKNLNKEQVRSLASVIAVEYRFLKVTELLLFFHRFKTGRYGRFYGSVDPMVITCALREFMRERNDMIAQYEQERRERESESKEPTMTHEEYLKLKEQEQSKLEQK